MSTRVQFRRGTTAQHGSFTGLSGEMTIDTDKNTVVVHDGSTQGGYPLVKEAYLGAIDTDLIPDMTGGANNVSLHSLGSATAMWKDVFIGPGSLYINGTKVLEESGSDIIVSADPDQSLIVQTSGTGDLSLQAAGSGDIELDAAMNSIQLKSTVQISAGKNITSSDGNPISFTDGIDMNNNTITGLGTPSVAADVATKGYVDAIDTRVIEVNDSDAALRITQTGSGHALLVEDSANPDASPFYVDNAGNCVISGNLTVNGTTTTVNSTTVDIADSFLTLNSGETGTPSQDAGIEVERGTETNAQLKWNESSNLWSVSNPFHVNAGDFGGDIAVFNRQDTANLQAGFNGTGGQMSMYFQDGSGIYNAIGVDAGVLKFTQGTDSVFDGTERMRLTSSGELLIGRTTDHGGYNLQVSGHAQISNNLTLGIQGDAAGSLLLAGPGTGETEGGEIKLFVGDDYTSSLHFFAIDARADELRMFISGGSLSATNIWQYNSISSDHYWYTNDTQRMRLDSSGRLGIGGTASDTTAKLEIIDGTAAHMVLRDNGGGLGANMNAKLRFSANGSDHGFIGFATSGGNMGVTNHNGNLYLQADTNQAMSNSRVIFSVDDANTGWITSDGLVFGDDTSVPTAPTSWTTSTPRIKFHGDGGQGGIYQTTDRGGIMLTSNDDSLILASGDNGRKWNSTYVTAGGEDIYLCSDSNVRLLTDLQEGWGTQHVFTIQNNGIGYAPGGWQTTSDVRYKENIVDITGALDKVNAIRGVTFDRINDRHNLRYVGVIAQEVEPVLPEAVTDSEDGMKSVDYGGMVGLLIEAIKELKDKNEQLEQRLAALEN